MSLRILHVLDHLAPVHSGYTFRTLSVLCEQRRLGWKTFRLTGLKQAHGASFKETVDGWHLFRAPVPPSVPLSLLLPGLAKIALMRMLEQRLQQVAEQVRSDVLHAHSPVRNALPALCVDARLGIPIGYELAGNAESLKDMLLQVLSGYDVQSRMRKAGHSFVGRERNWRASVGRYRSVYRDLAMQGVA